MEKFTDNFELNISIEPVLLKDLKESNMKLCLIRSFRNPLSDKLNPTIWIASADYTENNTFIWEQEFGYKIYISNSDSTNENVLNKYPVNFGQTFKITHSEGRGKMFPNLITAGDGVFITNTTMKDFFVGLEQEWKFNGSKQPSTPISKQKIRSGSSIAICPATKLYVTFAPSDTAPGTILDNSCASGILIEMTNLDDDLVARKVQYKTGSDGISRQWEAFTTSVENWSTVIAKDQSLTSYLVPEDKLRQLIQQQIQKIV